MKIGCAILAGGKSSRMGTDKALLPYHEKNFIEQLMEEFDDFDEKLIARGKNPDCSRGNWTGLDDIYPDCGPMGGVHAALTHCRSDALFLVSCDMPLMKKTLAFYLISRLNEGTDAVVSVTNDGRKHPACGVYRKSVLPVLDEQLKEGNNRMMAALNRLSVKYVFLNEKDSLMLQNINTPHDYQSLKKTEMNQ